MRIVRKNAGPARSRPRRAAFAATALLAGCANLVRDTAMVIPPAPGAILLRVVQEGAVPRSPPGGPAAEHVGILLWNLDTGQPARGQDAAGVTLEANTQRPAPPAPARGPKWAGGFDAVPSPEAGAAGWRIDANLPPGRYFLQFVPRGRELPASAAFSVPPRVAAARYIGTFRARCDPASGCRVIPEAEDETAAARAMVAAVAPGQAPPVTALAQPYPPSLSALGLAPPGVPRISVDARSWAAAIDWRAVAAAGAAPPASDAPRSEGEESAPRFVSVSSIGSDLGNVMGGAMGAAGGMGAVLLLGVIVVAIPVGLVALAIREQRQARIREDEARAEAEALRAAALAQEQWNPCAAGIAATLSPDNVERHLRTRLAPGRPAGRRAALPGTWDATVTRVVFRHCEGGTDRHGVEVATRWTARRAGEAEPAFDAAYARTVAGATPDPRLVHQMRAPWELPVATEAACRPLADYCGAAGSALLLQEVTRGVTEARDAIAGGR